MGLMRAFSLKRSSALPSRLAAIKGRPQISLPTELISTTNNISYSAPSVESMQQKATAVAATSTYSETYSETYSDTASTTTSTHNDVECPATPSFSSQDSSRRSSHLSDSAPSLSYASSASSSPMTPPTQHAFASGTNNSYFNTDSFSKSVSTISIADEETVDPFTVIAPALPRRAPSHSKREHERLARRRSQRISMKLDAPAAETVLAPAPLSAAIVMPELAEVDEEVIPAFTIVEVAEEQESVMERLMRELIDEEEEARYMREHSLKKFSIGGYLDLVGDVWGKDVYMVSDVMVNA